jgi:hypothetical protein
MKSTFVSVIRWTSAKLSVAAEKIETSTVPETVLDAAVNATNKAKEVAADTKSWVKKTYATIQAWVIRQRQAFSKWLAERADELEKMETFPGIAIGFACVGTMFALCVLFQVFLAVFVWAGFIVLMCDLFIIGIYSLMSMAFFGLATQAWQDCMATEATRAERKAAARAKHHQAQQAPAAA